jgi:hypothetical protein
MGVTFQEFFSPLQHAIATLTGCKTIVSGVRALLEADPELLVLHVDMANAFIENDRVAIFEELSPGSLSCSTLLCSPQLFAIQKAGWHLGDSPLLRGITPG